MATCGHYHKIVTSCDVQHFSGQKNYRHLYGRFFYAPTNLVEIGSPTRNTEQLGVIPGHHTWGVDSNFYYRIVGLEYEIAIEIYLPKLGVTLQYGDPALLYLAPEPAAITAFKQVIAIQRANRARDKLLHEFSKRFNCNSQGYIAPVTMPTNNCRL